MKKANYLLLVLVFIAIPTHVLSQNISKETIIGNWVFNYEASMDLMNNKAKEYYGIIDTSKKEEIIGAFKNRKITFNEDGSFSQQLFNGKISEGKWVLGNGNTIDISNESGYVISFRVKNHDGSKLIIIPQKADGKNANMLFTEWYLNRN